MAFCAIVIAVVTLALLWYGQIFTFSTIGFNMASTAVGSNAQLHFPIGEKTINRMVDPSSKPIKIPSYVTKEIRQSNRAARPTSRSTTTDDAAGPEWTHLETKR